MEGERENCEKSTPDSGMSCGKGPITEACQVSSRNSKEVGGAERARVGGAAGEVADSFRIYRELKGL